MAKIKLEDGTEVEAFTSEEVDAKLKEKEAELNSSFEKKSLESQTALQKLENEKKDLEGKINSGGGGGQAENFKTLKDAMDKKDKDISELREAMKKTEETRVNDFRDGIISKISGGDKELEKKISHHLNETLKSVPANSEKEMMTKIQSAVKLSIDNNNRGVLDNIMNDSGGRGFIPSPGSGPVEFSAAEKSLGAKMGISEDDYKKYGPKLKTKI